MKTIKIFIASSDELRSEREKFDTLFAHLNNIFKKRDIQLEAVRWEFLDSSMGKEHKQEEYNREIKECDICVVMFWQRFGEYTNTELKVADTELREGRKPSRIYVFFKEPGDVAYDLQLFKDAFEREYGHFYCKFDCIDKLQLDFVLQLEHFLNSNLVKVENSEVKLDNVLIAHLDNIGFAAGNEKYRTLRERLEKIEKELAELEPIYQTTQNETIGNIINNNKRERENLRKELGEHEQILLNSAINIAQFAGKRISERMKRAVALFEEGKVSEANAILDEAERDADDILNGLREIKAVGKQAIEELILRASTMIADDKYSIDERIERVDAIYAKADELAHECDYDEEKYDKLLFEYAAFLSIYAKYNKAVEIYNRVITLRERLYGTEHPDTAKSYNNIGVVYNDLSEYEKALEYHLKALKIKEKILGIEHHNTAMSYNNIGVVYNDLSEYGKALEYHLKALKIKEKILGTEHPDTAMSYNNIGNVYNDLSEYEKALEYHLKALAIFEKIWRIKHLNTAASYNNIGNVYSQLDEYETALEYYLKALKIQEKAFGTEHPDTATSYNNIGVVYDELSEYEKALEYYFKALKIFEKVLGTEHPNTAYSYDNVGGVYDKLSEYEKALEYYFKALKIYEKVLGAKHIETIVLLENIETVKAKIKE
ncbi:MAG: tetratricopeptide repeat protein [Alistipes sp.]|nr:tetratricopeptide repeat protein [Alistipes sp.]